VILLLRFGFIRGSSAWMLLVMLAGAVACSNPQQVDTETGKDANCALVLDADDTLSDWETGVQNLIDTAPPDSVVSVAFGGIQAPVSEFTTIVESHEGTVTYSFQTMPAVVVSVTVRGLAVLFELRGDLYAYISIGQTGGHVLTECA